MVNGLRERRVLISATGFNANTLKIRPPLVFSAENVARLLTEFETVAKSQGIQKWKLK
jgi:4-aminobutyrate aminotransferase-like enzyme